MRTAPLTVCFCTAEFPPHPGGAARSAERIVNGLAAAGIDVHVCVADPGAVNGDVAVRSERLAERLVLYRVPMGGGFHLFGEFIAALAENIHFDLFHGFVLHMAAPCIAVAASQHRPVIASIRGIESQWLGIPAYADLVRPVLDQSAWITSVSTHALAEIAKLCDVSGRSGFLPNAIDLSEFPPADPRARRPGLIGTVCTFREKKNVPLLVSAYTLLPRELRSGLLLVGDYPQGSEGDATRRQIDDLATVANACGEVVLTGFVDRSQVAARLSEMSVFVCSSDHEGLPNAVLEAAAAGVPIVSTAVDGMLDVFTHEHDVLFVPTRNAQALADAIVQCLSDCELSHRLATNARKTVRRLSPERERADWIELYERVCRRTAATTAS